VERRVLAATGANTPTLAIIAAASLLLGGGLLGTRRSTKHHA
jgi:LPXTG-motif cell wall-anchored protein